ncbi:OsmC family protein [Litorivivens sp.]|uniref:OsmC family protein n=1 Tax=Litorivivens sp. TaxID=2020868 RepID=UPI0035615650
MVQLPQDYSVAASALNTGLVVTQCGAKSNLIVEPPPAFGGSGNAWSPEELLLAALADCYILTFRDVAARKGFVWRQIACRAEGVLDRVGSGVGFAAFNMDCVLQIDESVSKVDAESLLRKTAKSCFVSRALAVEPSLSTSVEILSGDAV